MSPKVTVLDYGSGNLPSARKALGVAAGDPARVVVSDDPAVVARADRIVLPGVGAFAACMGALNERDGLVEAMNEAVRQRGAPFLGICVGMQLLATRGLEFGVTPGLDWIGGDVRLLEPANPSLKIGICGEHAGDPASLAFFARLGVDYVSCSPYRVPIARLALAQAA